jgi:hypothetical protein
MHGLRRHGFTALHLSYERDHSIQPLCLH